MRIEDRMSLWAAKKPRDEVSELLLEGAQEIADLRRQREEDGKQMGALIAGYQKMQGLCIDGKYLTDEEREAVKMSATVADVGCEEAKRWVGMPRWTNGGVDDASWQRAVDMNAARAATLRGLLERLGGER
jgi:hypothetical protein